MPRRAGIILCGGLSRRMRRPKALLPFGPEAMLQRVVRRVAQAVDTVVVVAACQQKLPPLPGSVNVVRDRRGGRGPLEGLATGLGALEPDIEAAYLTGCDVPLLVPAFIARVIDSLGDEDCAAPRHDGFFQPLAAAYRPRVRMQVEAMLAEDMLGVHLLFERVPTRVIEIEELRSVDPELLSLRNCNTPADYRAALAIAGIAQ